MKKRFDDSVTPNYNLELNQERAFWENQLNQKINFFLLFFALIIAGVVLSKSREFTVTVLLVGAVILWFLSLMIMNATRKINIVIKELMKDEKYPVALIDSRSRGRIFRIIVGYGLPIFCAVVVTLAFISGVSGLYSFGFPTKTEVIQTVEKTVDKVKEKLANQKKADTSAKYFQSVDNAIAEGDQKVVIVDSLPKAVPVSGNSKTISQKSTTPVKSGSSSNHFKTVDNVIAEENAKQYVVPPIPSQSNIRKTQQATAQKPTNDTRNFQNVDNLLQLETTIEKRTDTLKQSKEIAKPTKTVPIQKSTTDSKHLQKVNNQFRVDKTIEVKVDTLKRSKEIPKPTKTVPIQK